MTGLPLKQPMEISLESMTMEQGRVFNLRSLKSVSVTSGGGEHTSDRIYSDSERSLLEQRRLALNSINRYYIKLSMQSSPKSPGSEAEPIQQVVLHHRRRRSTQLPTTPGGFPMSPSPPCSPGSPLSPLSPRSSISIEMGESEDVGRSQSLPSFMSVRKKKKQYKEPFCILHHKENYVGAGHRRQQQLVDLMQNCLMHVEKDVAYQSPLTYTMLHFIAETAHFQRIQIQGRPPPAPRKIIRKKIKTGRTTEAGVIDGRLKGEMYTLPLALPWYVTYLWLINFSRNHPCHQHFSGCPSTPRNKKVRLYQKIQKIRTELLLGQELSPWEAVFQIHTLKLDPLLCGG